MQTFFKRGVIRLKKNPARCCMKRAGRLQTSQQFTFEEEKEEQALLTG